MKTVIGVICVIILLITSLAFCQNKSNKSCPHYKHQKEHYETIKTLTFAVFYASNAIDTINVECYDYSVNYGRRNGVCFVVALINDTAYCENCRVHYVRKVCSNVCTTSAPVKVLKFE